MDEVIIFISLTNQKDRIFDLLFVYSSNEYKSFEYLNRFTNLLLLSCSESP